MRLRLSINSENRLSIFFIKLKFNKTLCKDNANLCNLSAQKKNSILLVGILQNMDNYPYSLHYSQSHQKVLLFYL